MKKRLIILMLLAFGLGFGMNAMAQKGSCNRSGQGRGQGNKACVYGKQAGFADADKDGLCDNRKDKAEIMNTSLASVESLMHRAKQGLQKKLVHHFSEYVTKNKSHGMHTIQK